METAVNPSRHYRNRKTNMTTPLIIVESETKAELLRDLLGNNFIICATRGHIADIAKGRSAIDIKNNFQVKLELTERGKKSLLRIQKALKGASEIYIATKVDKNGAEIAGEILTFLQTELQPKHISLPDLTDMDFRRSACISEIISAIELAGPVNTNLLAAVETRRILDRMYGYELTQLLRKRVPQGIGAGRVKSFILRLLAEREQQRIAHAASPHFQVCITTSSVPNITAKLVRINGQDPPHNQKDLVLELQDSIVIVRSITHKTTGQKPNPPYMRTTLLRDAAIKLNLSEKETQRSLNDLHNGFQLGNYSSKGPQAYISSPYTSCEVLSDEVHEAVSDEIRNSPRYGPHFVAQRHQEDSKPEANEPQAETLERLFMSVQESIHPLLPLRSPESISHELTPTQLQIYQLIWDRTMQSVMTECVFTTTTILFEVITNDGKWKTLQFEAKVSNVCSLGFQKYAAADSVHFDGERSRLPAGLKVGHQFGVESITVEPHRTLPPERYTEKTLWTELEEKGITSFKTYFSTLESLRKSDAICCNRKSISPSWAAIASADFLAKHFAPLVDAGFTSLLQKQLESIASGTKSKESVLNDFYYGSIEGNNGLKQMIENALSSSPSATDNRFLIGSHPESHEEIAIHLGPYGAYVRCGTETTSATSLIAPSDWTVSKALNAFTNRQRAPQIIGEWNGSIITLMYGYRGAFLKWGTHSSPPAGMKRPKVASLLKSMIWETVSLDSAVRALSFPRKLGRNPFDGKQVLVCNGPFGTYVRSGTRNKKLVSESAAFSITLQEAAEMFQYKVAAKQRKSKSN